MRRTKPRRRARRHGEVAMDPYPHTYRSGASSGSSGVVAVATAGVAPLATAPPPEFGGPGGHWSPETLLVGALADCFVLSFRSVARAARFEWVSLDCQIEGVLDKHEGVTRFTEFRTRATLVSPQAATRPVPSSCSRRPSGCA